MKGPPGAPGFPGFKGWCQAHSLTSELLNDGLISIRTTEKQGNVVSNV